MFDKRVILFGVILWAAGTVLLRVAGHIVFPNGVAGTLLLYAASFALFAFGVPWILARLRIETHAWPYAALLLMLPTLILDPFTCALFPSIFPNMAASAAGAFGGWMLICCGGAAAGVLRR